MNTCKHCNDTLFTEVYDTCMTCFEKNHTQANMEKTIEDYQKEIKSLKNELVCYIKTGEIKTDVLKSQQKILDKILHELPVGYIPNATYKNIPEIISYYVKDSIQLTNDWDKAIDVIEEFMPQFFADAIDGSITESVKKLIGALNKSDLNGWTAKEQLETLEKEIKVFYEYYAGFGAKKDLTTTQMLNHILQNVPNYKPTEAERDYEDLKRSCAHYITALQEITKKNRKAKTCQMIALKALGELTDEDHQPELLIEENLKLRMQVEDLESKIIEYTIDKVFIPLEDWERNPITHCQDCGEYWGYHHEEYCKAKVLDNADKHSKMYP